VFSLPHGKTYFFYGGSTRRVAYKGHQGLAFRHRTRPGRNGINARTGHPPITASWCMIRGSGLLRQRRGVILGEFFWVSSNCSLPRQAAAAWGPTSWTMSGSTAGDSSRFINHRGWAHQQASGLGAG